MNTNISNFNDYKMQFERPFVVEKIEQGFNCFRGTVHKVVTRIDEAYQFPDLIIKTVQVAVALFSNMTFLCPFLTIPKKFCKEAKNFANCFKSLKSVDGMLNLKWNTKIIVINFSGITFFTLSLITLLDRFDLYSALKIKRVLSNIPLIGMLSYGGLWPLSIVGLMSTAALFSYENQKKVEMKLSTIAHQKISYWSNSLTLDKVQLKQKKYESKLEELKENIDFLCKLSDEGMDQLEKATDSLHQTSSCQKAINQLTKELKGAQREYDHYEKKHADWTQLEQLWSQQSEDQIKNFQEAKKRKWINKLRLLEKERRYYSLGTAMNVVVASKQLFILIAALSGYGIVSFPAFVDNSIEVFVSGGGIASYFMKKSNKKRKISSIDLSNYISFET